MKSPHHFVEAFQDQLDVLFALRRDARHFRPDPLPHGLIDQQIEIACRGPSVGDAKTWRFGALVCLGFPGFEAETPELVRMGWQDSLPPSEKRLTR
jgi:hypothetical protein